MSHRLPKSEYLDAYRRLQSRLQDPLEWGKQIWQDLIRTPTVGIEDVWTLWSEIRYSLSLKLNQLASNAPAHTTHPKAIVGTTITTKLLAALLIYLYGNFIPMAKSPIARTTRVTSSVCVFTSAVHARGLNTLMPYGPRKMPNAVPRITSLTYNYRGSWTSAITVRNRKFQGYD